MDKQRLIKRLHEEQITPNNLASQSFSNAIEIAIRLAEQLDEHSLSQKSCELCRTKNEIRYKTGKKAIGVDRYGKYTYEVTAVANYCPKCGGRI